jgi:hypothetical protein
MVIALEEDTAQDADSYPTGAIANSYLARGLDPVLLIPKESGHWNNRMVLLETP